MSLSIRFMDGTVNEVTLQDLTGLELTDCLSGDDGFLTLNFTDGSHVVAVYLPKNQVSILLASIAEILSKK